MSGQRLSEREFFIQWHLTERCNLRCGHCYQSGDGSQEMSFDEIGAFFDEIRETLASWSEMYDIRFDPSFNITGGEPFLRDDLFSIIRLIRGEGIAVYILSNGTLIDGRTAGMLSDAGVDGVQVSIEGPEMVHDRIRGSGSFIRAMQGARALLGAGLKVTLNVTLSEVNAGHIGELAELARSTGVQRLGFSRLVPCGRGQQFLKSMMGRDRVKQVYQLLASYNSSGLEIVTGDPVAAQMGIGSEKDTGCTAYSGCAAGISGLTLRPDGTMNPCRRLDIPIGNIRTDSLREVWATSGVLHALRDKRGYKGKCGACSRWAECRGCRAVAYAYSLSMGEGDLLAEDPQCFIED